MDSEKELIVLKSDLLEIMRICFTWSRENMCDVDVDEEITTPINTKEYKADLTTFQNFLIKHNLK